MVKSPTKNLHLSLGPLKVILSRRVEKSDTNHPVTWYNISEEFLERFSSPPCLNPLTPNDPYRGRTASLTSKVAFYIFIQQI